MPPVSLRTDAPGVEIDPARLGRLTTVVTFIAPTGAAEISDLLLDRLAELDSRLRSPQRERVRMVLVMLETDEDAWVVARAAMARRGLDETDRWIIIDDARPRAVNFASLFGVVVWRDPEGPIEHTVSVAVLEEGRVEAIFHGLDGWGIGGLLAATAGAAR